MNKQVKLTEWAETKFKPAPSLFTLRKMAREGRIDPPAIKVGKHYYVQEDALPRNPNRRQTLVQKLKQAA